jgi:hypothetical protein
MQDVIKNKTLFVARKLLEIIEQKPYRVHGSGITLERDDVFELSIDEIIEALKRLEDREILSFDDEEDKYDPGHLDYIGLYFEKDKLVNFVNTTKDKLYGLTTQYKNKEGSIYVLTALASFLRFEKSKEAIDFSELDNKYIDVAIWIDDHSGAIKVVYTEEPDVEWKDLKRPEIIGISEVPKKFIITDLQIIKDLENEIRQSVIMPQQKRIRLFFETNNMGMNWRCANCGHFLEEQLTNKRQVADYLNDFYIHKFRICYKCRKRNYFSINQNGDIKFAITNKRMFSEKETREDKIKEIDRLMKKIERKNKY